VRSVGHISPGDNIDIRFADGQMSAVAAKR